jgi:hypothetical protein
MCDELDDERMLAFWRAIEAARAVRRPEGLEDETALLPTLMPGAEPARRTPKPLTR